MLQHVANGARAERRTDVVRAGIGRKRAWNLIGPSPIRVSSKVLQSHGPTADCPQGTFCYGSGSHTVRDHSRWTTPWLSSRVAGTEHEPRRVSRRYAVERANQEVSRWA